MLEVPKLLGDAALQRGALQGTSPAGTQTLAKGLRLLKEIAGSNTRGARLTELVDRLGLEPPTAHRLLRCLVDEGFLWKDASNRYHLGGQLFELGLLTADHYDLGPLAFRPIHALAETHGETVFLTRRTGLNMVCVERVDGSYAIRGLSMTVGTRRPIGLGASGVALLAGMDSNEVEAILRTNDARYRAYYDDGIGAKLRHRIQAARRNGYAIANGLLTPNAVGIGVPVLSGNSVPIFSLSIVATKAQLTPKRQAQFITALQRTATEFGQKIAQAS